MTFQLRKKKEKLIEGLEGEITYIATTTVFLRNCRIAAREKEAKKNKHRHSNYSLV